jgi:hypothetical protein
VHLISCQKSELENFNKHWFLATAAASIKFILYHSKYLYRIKLQFMQFLLRLQIDRHWGAHMTWWPPWVYKQYDAVSENRIFKTVYRH